MLHLLCWWVAYVFNMPEFQLAACVQHDSGEHWKFLVSVRLHICNTSEPLWQVAPEVTGSFATRHKMAMATWLDQFQQPQTQPKIAHPANITWKPPPPQRKENRPMGLAFELLVVTTFWNLAHWHKTPNGLRTTEYNEISPKSYQVTNNPMTRLSTLFAKFWHLLLKTQKLSANDDMRSSILPETGLQDLNTKLIVFTPLLPYNMEPHVPNFQICQFKLVLKFPLRYMHIMWTIELKIYTRKLTTTACMRKSLELNACRWFSGGLFRLLKLSLSHRKSYLFKSPEITQNQILFIYKSKSRTEKNPEITTVQNKCLHLNNQKIYVVFCWHLSNHFGPETQHTDCWTTIFFVWTKNVTHNASTRFALSMALSDCSRTMQMSSFWKNLFHEGFAAWVISLHFTLSLITRLNTEHACKRFERIHEIQGICTLVPKLTVAPDLLSSCAQLVIVFKKLFLTWEICAFPKSSRFRKQQMSHMAIIDLHSWRKRR